MKKIDLQGFITSILLLDNEMVKYVPCPLFLTVVQECSVDLFSEVVPFILYSFSIGRRLQESEEGRAKRCQRKEGGE